MTGPETKILTGYGSLSQQHAKPGEILSSTTGNLICLLRNLQYIKPTYLHLLVLPGVFFLVARKVQMKKYPWVFEDDYACKIN